MNGFSARVASAFNPWAVPSALQQPLLSLGWGCLCFFDFESGSHCVALDDLELIV